MACRGAVRACGPRSKQPDAVFLQFGMIRVSLTDTTRAELHALRRTDLPAVARDRLEMVLSVRRRVVRPPDRRAPRAATRTPSGQPSRASPPAGLPAFYPDDPGPAPDHGRRATGDRPAVRQLLGQDRTWTGRPAGRRPPPRRHRHRAPPDPPLPGPAEGRLPPHRPDRRSTSKTRPRSSGPSRSSPALKKKRRPAG